MGLYRALMPELSTLTTSDGLLLEARWDHPRTEASGAVVIAHPHPLQGGSMYAPLLNSITDTLTSYRRSVLRFNFRGVGRSTGDHAGGSEETADLAAAWDHASARFPAVTVAGWSFGGGVALRWMAEAKARVRLVAIAPPVEGLPSADMLPAGDIRIIIGSRDRIVDPAAVQRYGAVVGARVTVIDGADHFFVLRGRHLADLIVGDRDG